MSNFSKGRLKSTWTPITYDEANVKLYGERRNLINKWYEKWNDTQRKQVLKDLILQSKTKQLEYAGELLDDRRPVHRQDFTRTLPRVLSLYIFTYLDPRSLCRCSQVCWYWKYLADIDLLWLPKCVRLGWILSFSPSPYEEGVWKRHYIENILTFQHLKPRSQLEEAPSLDDEPQNPLPRSMTTPISKRPPWRAAQPKPKDTWRNNILDNNDDVAFVHRRRLKGLYSKEADEITKAAKTKINTGLRADKSPSRVPRAKSVADIQDERLRMEGRPDWAKPVRQISQTAKSKADKILVHSSTNQLTEIQNKTPVANQERPRSTTNHVIEIPKANEEGTDAKLPTNQVPSNPDHPSAFVKVKSEKFEEKPWAVKNDENDSS